MGSDSNHQGTREATREQVARVLAVLNLHRGKRNAIKRVHLCEAAGISGEGRTLTAARHQINADPTIPEVVGVDMAAGAYYLCATPLEVDETERYDRGIAMTHLASANAIRAKAARAVAIQPSLIDFAEISA